jgi:hypothetical protein
MKYTIKAHPTTYKGVLFRSRLEARWAAFFDLAGWQWEYEPIDLPGWTPDFLIRIPCGHSECDGCHTILVEVKPYFSVDEFKSHECDKYRYGCRIVPGDGVYAGEMVLSDESRLPADATAGFGYHPRVAEWEMSHGAGGGVECIRNWVFKNGCSGNDQYIEELWERAGHITRFRP